MKIKDVLHFQYEIAGHVLIFLNGVWWAIRDSLFPPNEDAVLFVAHPDDDSLFFYSFIKEKHPYVVLLTTGGIIRRVFPFYRAMKSYGVRYRAFDFPSRDITREDILVDRISGVLEKGSFKICATHNIEGEYGHIMHKCVHRCVKKAWKNELYVPACESSIDMYPLEPQKMEEKNKFLQTYYKGEYPTLCTFRKWINNEKIERTDV